MAPISSPDLKVLCRKLTSLQPNQLLRQLPTLNNHVLRSKEVLSAPQDPKAAKDDSNQTSVLVHKLKTTVTTLLNGRSREGRLVAISLVKAVVDVAGWEGIRSSEPWVRGLMAIVQVSLRILIWNTLAFNLTHHRKQIPAA